jgi:ArsR family transcriptional regulator, virulence genes transcriptional regulator
MSERNCARLRIYEKMNIETEKMSQAADEAVTLLQSLGNRSRLMIMCQLVGGEKSVGQLAEFLQARESTVSQHLALLRKDRLVSTRRQGQTIFYAVASEPARRVLETIYDTYCRRPTG